MLKEIICSILCYIDKNIGNIIVTILSVVASGWISLLISRRYFEKGIKHDNRENLKVSVIFPTIQLLEKNCTLDSYKQLYNIRTSYGTKYFEKGEILLFDNLLSAYKSYIDYRPEVEIHKMLIAYFKRKLSENGLEWEPIVTEDEGGNFEGEPPVGYFELEDDIGKVLEKYPYQYMSKECQEALEAAFTKCLSGISSQKKIAFFENTSINKLIREAEITKTNKTLLAVYENAKSDFMNLSVVREMTE